MLLLVALWFAHANAFAARALVDDLLHLDERMQRLWHTAQQWGVVALCLVAVLIVIPLWLLLWQQWQMRREVRALQEQVKKMQ